MFRKVIKKVGVVLLAAGLSIGMFSPSEIGRASCRERV